MSALEVAYGLPPGAAADISRLAADCTGADGVDPLNEAARLGLATGTGTHLLARWDGRVVGYATSDGGVAQLLVAPAYRRQGIGTALLRTLTGDTPGLDLWAFGGLEPAAGFAQKYGYAPVRELRQMAATVPAWQATLAGRPIESFPAYTPAALDALLTCNARAFATHPEQGAMTAADVQQRLASPGFDPAGLFLAWADGKVAGFHWTKWEPPVGEVYVLGVDPAAAGRGLGRRLLDAGLAYLAAQGATTVRLWVEADNFPATTLYATSGFSVVGRDLRYRELGRIAPGGQPADQRRSEEDQ